MSQPTSDNPTGLAPFRVEELRLDAGADGRFRPGAVVQITPALRESGLLVALPGEEVKTLLFVLTFVHPNGWIQPTLPELAQAMRLPEPLARQKLARLARFVWQGRPLLNELRRENGLHAWSPARHVLDFAQRPQESPAAAPIVPSAGREAVIAHSRARYARPRAEVEAEIAALNGWDRRGLTPGSAVSTDTLNDFAMPDQIANDPATRAAFRALVEHGVPPEQAADLLLRFPLERISEQIAWLPYRAAKNPTRFLMSAIERGYEMPPLLRNRQRLDAALRASAETAEADLSQPDPTKNGKEAESKPKPAPMPPAQADATPGAPPYPPLF